MKSKDSQKEIIINKIISNHAEVIAKADTENMSYGEIRKMFEDRKGLGRSLDDKLQVILSRADELRVELSTQEMILDSAKAKSEDLMNSSDELTRVKEKIKNFKLEYDKLVSVKESARKEHDEKIIAYKEDSLFMHLIDVGYDTPQYKNIWPITIFHNWIAKKIDFSQALYNYEMLKKIKKASVELLNNFIAEHSKAEKEVIDIEADILSKSSIKEAENRHSNVVARIKANAEAEKECRDEIRAFTESRDNSIQLIKNKMAEYMSRFSIATLERIGDKDNVDPDFIKNTFQ